MEKTNYTLLILEDKEVLRHSLLQAAESTFRSFEKNTALSPFLPQRVVGYPNLDELLAKEEPSSSSFYGWITDWRLGGEHPSTKDLNSSPVYTALVTVLGGYSAAQILGYYDDPEEQLNDPDKESFHMMYDYRKLRTSLGNDLLFTLFRFILNSGYFTIYTAHPADALFRTDVELALSEVGNEIAPLVLHKEKTINVHHDAYALAQGYLLAAQAYGGKLPLLGECEGSLPSGRARLRKDMAEMFSLARRLSDNQLDLFLKKFSTEC